jgi:hypothetical protein
MDDSRSLPTGTEIDTADEHGGDGPDPSGRAPSGSIDTTNEPAFRRLVVNTLLSGVTSSFLWFALTFWVYLETKSVVATGVIGGAFGLVGAFIGPTFGTYVDHHSVSRGSGSWSVPRSPVPSPATPGASRSRRA